MANPKTVVNDRYARKEIKQQVIRIDQLINFLKNLKSDSKSNLKTMQKTGESILAMNVSERTDYIKKFADLVAEVNDNSSTAEKLSEEKPETNQNENLICPRCGGQLILRTARQGSHAGNQFYGCSNYPNCRFIRNLD